jgi:pimeloyl-ACP methyl ester carboxylesterase
MPDLIQPVGELQAPDGGRFAYYDTGGPGEVIVAVNGLGGPFSAWRYQVEYLRDRYRFVSWDYRGLFHSAIGDAPSDVTVERHASDLEFMLDELGIDRPAMLMGWSMGVQVALEHYARAPQQVSHLVLLNGTFGRPLDNMPMPGSHWWAPRALAQVRRFGRPGQAALGRITKWPETVSWMKRLRIISPTLEDEFFRTMAEQFGTLNIDTYVRTLAALGEHDGTRVLDRVTVPTLVITGDKDRMTPANFAAEMAARIRNAELLTVRGATHYTAVEYPELVNLRIEKFLREHPHGAQPTASVRPH